MSLTYATLKTLLQDKLEEYETTFVTHIDDAIRRVEQNVYNSIQIPALRKTSTTALTLNVRTLTAPTDFLAPFEFAVVNGSGVYSYLLNKDPSWIREAFPDPATKGLPQYYALLDHQTFIFSQIPDASYATELHYYYYPQSLADAAAPSYPNNTTWLSINFESVILYGCLLEMYLYMKGDADLLQAFDVKYKEALATLAATGGMDLQDAYKMNPSRLKFDGSKKVK